jgi:hypothetical protein
MTASHFYINNSYYVLIPQLMTIHFLFSCFKINPIIYLMFNGRSVNIGILILPEYVRVYSRDQNFDPELRPEDACWNMGETVVRKTTYAVASREWRVTK